MRLWSIHPRYLDAKGLVAAWREGLLAQKVLEGRTKGYRHHPQLARFQECSDPLAAVGAWLAGINEEACARGYCFDASKIAKPRWRGKIPLKRGQLRYEAEHLMVKLKTRDPARAKTFATVQRPACHPLFQLKPGGLESWERP